MRLLFATAGALLLSTAALAQSDAGAERTMTATIVEGTVTVERDDGSARSVEQGMPLRERDVLQTASNSRLEISISDGTVLRVGESTKLELRVSPPVGKAFAARLWLGAVWAKVHKLLQDETFEIETENAVAGVRGTEFLVQAGGTSRDDSVRVYEGAVEVRSHGSEWAHRVEAGRELAFRRGLHPDGPKPFDAASDREHPLMRWVRERTVRTPGGSDQSEPRAPKGEKQRGERPARHQRFLERFRGR